MLLRPEDFGELTLRCAAAAAGMQQEVPQHSGSFAGGEIGGEICHFAVVLYLTFSPRTFPFLQEPKLLIIASFASFVCPFFFPVVTPPLLF